MVKRILFAATIVSLLHAASAFAAVELKLAHSSPATIEDKLEYASQKFKAFVEEQSKGALKVTSYPASQLGQEREALEGTQMGTIELCALSTGPMPGLFPEIMLLDLPYIFPDREAAYALLDGPYGDKLREDMVKKSGVRILGWGENGFRCFTGNKALKGPADFRGIKFRLMENPMHQAMVKAMGAIPATIPFGELYTALAQGVVDGQENPISLITSMRFYEVQKHLTLDNHVYNPHVLMMNNDVYMGLSPELRHVLDEGGKVFSAEEREFNQGQSAIGLKMMREYGIVVYEPTAEDMQQFQEATLPTHKLARDRFGDKTVDEYLEAVKKAIADTRKN
ncbi:MAG: DctP family TRAP transporter solute-binding subunit [Deltaproteobacteria bacterium]|jgi:C4-dicarboxylate-binding protein DctP|nr:DctP family TRAP transporter solute-binding subunit [Deltaproteobacteria bacterium]